jgi:LacI family transcriptional regulator
VRLNDVAEHAGVSRGTVTSVLDHPERVSPDRLECVRASMKEPGFVRNEPARQLRPGPGNVLALSLIDTQDLYFSEVTRGIGDFACARGQTPSVPATALSREREQASLAHFLERRVGGILA